MTDIVHKAFWDAFEERLQDDPPDFSHAVTLIAEVKEVQNYAFTSSVKFQECSFYQVKFP